MTSRDRGGPPTLFCWRLAGPQGPSVYQALRVGEAVRAAAMRGGNMLGMARLPEAFHDGGHRAQHDHAFWLPEDRDQDGHIDHVTVYARSGISPRVVAALAAAEQIWLDYGHNWRLEPISLGHFRTGGLLGPSRYWDAVSAYVTPWNRTDATGLKRPDLSPDAQLRREIVARGWPEPVRIQWPNVITLRDTTFEPDVFVRSTRHRRAPTGAFTGAPRLEFETPLSGPVALGFGAHFGLGLFIPVVPGGQKVGAGRHPEVLRRRNLSTK